MGKGKNMPHSLGVKALAVRLRRRALGTLVIIANSRSVAAAWASSVSIEASRPRSCMCASCSGIASESERALRSVSSHSRSTIRCVSFTFHLPMLVAALSFLASAEVAAGPVRGIRDARRSRGGWLRLSAHKSGIGPYSWLSSLGNDD